MHPKVLFCSPNPPVAEKAHNVINIKSLYFILLLRLPSELFLLNKAKLPFPLLPFFSSISKAVGAEATVFSPNNKTPKHWGEKDHSDRDRTYNGVQQSGGVVDLGTSELESNK